MDRPLVGNRQIQPRGQLPRLDLRVEEVLVRLDFVIVELAHPLQPGTSHRRLKLPNPVDRLQDHQLLWQRTNRIGGERRTLLHIKSTTERFELGGQSLLLTTAAREVHARNERPTPLARQPHRRRKEQQRMFDQTIAWRAY